MQVTSGVHITDQDLTKHKGIHMAVRKDNQTEQWFSLCGPRAPGSPEHLFSRSTGKNRFPIHSKMSLAFSTVLTLAVMVGEPAGPSSGSGLHSQVYGAAAFPTTYSD